MVKGKMGDVTGRVKFEGLPREMIAMRVGREIKDGMYVNLGIGIPTLISDWIEGKDVVLQSEIGMLKTGPLAFGDDVNQDLINASCQPVTEGALQINARGDYAGWFNPSRGLEAVGNIGGSMDLAAGAKKLFKTIYSYGAHDSR